MESVTEIKRWLGTLYPTSYVGVDEGGLTLVEIAVKDNKATGAYLEIGGIPANQEGKEGS